MEDDYKTINVKPDTKEKLDELKVHPNQSYNEVIWMLIKEIEVVESQMDVLKQGLENLNDKTDKVLKLFIEQQIEE